MENIKLVTLRIETLLTCACSLSEYTKVYGEWQIKMIPGIGVNSSTTIRNPYVIVLAPNADTWYVLGAEDQGNKMFLFDHELDAKSFLDKLAKMIDDGKYKIGCSA